MPDRWAHDIQHLTQDEINRAVSCTRWQTFRKSLKGLSTERKLRELETWLSWKHCTCDADQQVQVDNYINALKRGGQLDLEGNVVR